MELLLVVQLCVLLGFASCSISSKNQKQLNDIPFLPDELFDTIPQYSLLNGAMNFLPDWAGNNDPDYGRRTPEIITSRGFKEETHHVTTLDGYILELHRIVNYKLRKSDVKGPIILNHGLGGSSVDFIINSPGGHIDEPLNSVGNNLGFELAKRGYDVWLGNSRGNLYSTNHTRIDPKDREFWDFSFDEMIKYDVPAVIAYVRAITNSSTVGWVGHSQGTLMIFGLLSERPEYADVIKPFIALAPVASLTYITSPVRYLANNFLLKIVEKKGGPLLPDGFLRKLFGEACSLQLIRFPQVCRSLAFFLAGGMAPEQVNASRLAIYVKDESYGTSSKNIVHFGQGIIRKLFAKYDYGQNSNMARYNSPDPPEYVLEKITSKDIVLMTGLADAFSDQLDLAILRKRLQVKPALDYVIPYQDWGHLEFIWGVDAGKYVNKPILDVLSKY